MPFSKADGTPFFPSLMVNNAEKKDLRYWLGGISEAKFSWRIFTSSELSGNLERHGFTWWDRLPSSWVSLCLAVLRKTKPFQWPNCLQFSPNNKDSVI